MLFTEFNMEEALQVRGEEQFELGHSQGLTEGLNQGLAEGELVSIIRLIRSKIAKQIPISDISNLLEFPEHNVSQIALLIQAHPDASDVQLAKEYMKQ